MAVGGMDPFLDIETGGLLKIGSVDMQSFASFGGVATPLVLSVKML